MLVNDYCEIYHNNKEYKSGFRILYASRVYDYEEMVSLVDSSLDFWLTSGRFSEEFEEEFADFSGINFCSIVNSGSSANLIAFMTLTSPLLGERAVKRGDEIITVAARFPTTVAPIIQYGAVPVFLDVDIPHYNIKTSDLEKALSNKTKAVIIAHTLGNPFDLENVRKFCDDNNLWLIENNCDALGSKYTINGEEKYTGTIGDIETSSFYPHHHMNMGEGGAVYTDNELLNKIIKSFRNWGRDYICNPGEDDLCGQRFKGQYGDLPKGYDHKYVYFHFGYNLKATDMQAATGLAQLKKFPSFIEKRIENFNRLKKGLANVEDELILPKASPTSEPCWFGFLITVKYTDNEMNRNKLVQELESKGVQTRMLFSGNIIKHPCFNDLKEGVDYKVIGNLENTNRIMNDSFWLGFYPGMTNEMIDFMIEVIKKIIYCVVMTKVSILIPTFNRAERLKRTIGSALSQDYPNLEVVVSDNHSEGHTYDVLKEFFNDSCFSYYKNDTNVGMVKNWRKGLFEYISGDYFMVLNDDDYLVEDNYISKAVNLIENNEDILMVYSNGFLYYESADKKYEIVPPFKEIEDGKDIFMSYLKVKHINSYWCNIIFNKEFTIKVNSFSNVNNLFCDMELFLKSCLCGNVGILKDFSSVYKYHSENLSDNVNKTYEYIIGNTDHATSHYDFTLKYNKLSDVEKLDWGNSVISVIFSACLVHTKYNFPERQNETVEFLKMKNEKVLEQVINSNLYKILMMLDKVYLFKFIYMVQRYILQKNLVLPSNFVSFIHKIQRSIGK